MTTEGSGQVRESQVKRGSSGGDRRGIQRFADFACLPQAASDCWTVTGGLIDPGEDVAGVDGLAFFGLEAFDFAFFGGANFVLHFHGFDDHQALAGFDFVADFYEKANDFAGHRGEDLLAAFGFERSLFSRTPGAGIADLGVEFVRAGL
jgi:hypothetical protein